MSVIARTKVYATYEVNRIRLKEPLDCKMANDSMVKDYAWFENIRRQKFKVFFVIGFDVLEPTFVYAGAVLNVLAFCI